MQIFISWSQPRSQQVALVLRAWLPSVLQAVHPYVSAADIEKGARWSQEIGERLKATDFGIVCVTAENIKSPWLNFEAGALAKQLEEARVYTFLMDVKPSDVEGPLAQFQATVASTEDVSSLVKSINARLEHPLSDAQVEQAFTVWWPQLHAELGHIRSTVQRSDGDSGQVRSDRQLLEELIEISREVQRSVLASEPVKPFEHFNDRSRIYTTSKIDFVTTTLNDFGLEPTDFNASVSDEGSLSIVARRSGFSPTPALLQELGKRARANGFTDTQFVTQSGATGFLTSAI